METKAKFKVIYMDEAVRFLESLDEKVRTKIAYNIEKAMLVVDKALFKKMDSFDIWEFRTLYNGSPPRRVACRDTANATLVVATHGLIKKTQRTPSKEILKAEELRKLYFSLKKK